MDAELTAPDNAEFSSTVRKIYYVDFPAIDLEHLPVLHIFIA